LFKKTNSFLQTIEAWIAAGSLLLLLALALFQILLRNILDFGYPEIDIINRHLLVVTGMMGAVLATARHAHIKTDALSLLLSPSLKDKIQLPLNIFSSTICLALCYYSAIFVLDEWQYAPANERWTLPFTLVYPISFALMSCHFILNEITAERPSRKRL
jgi:TRAP-type C4-dicarboxylate transport system permease small subunit